MTDIRFGIIGLGGISTRFALALKTVGGVKLTAVAARALPSALRAALVPICACFTGCDDVLSRFRLIGDPQSIRMRQSLPDGTKA